jgi:cyclophilin family peptidyl-prolyl cis-trans isomerase
MGLFRPLVLPVIRAVPVLAGSNRMPNSRPENCDSQVFFVVSDYASTERRSVSVGEVGERTASLVVVRGIHLVQGLTNAGEKVGYKKLAFRGL